MDKFRIATITLQLSTVALAGFLAFVPCRATDFGPLGLEVAWADHLQVPPGGRGVVSAQIWVDSSKVKTFASVSIGKQGIHVATDLLDENFEPIGPEKAKAEVQRLARRALGNDQPIEVSMIELPELRLVVATNDGLVQCWDAESGTLLWSTPCGATDSPAFPAALCKAGVALVQGDRLYLLDWSTGRQILVSNLPTGTANSIGVVDAPIEATRAEGGSATEINSLALVSDYQGLVNGYSFNNSIPPWSYRIIGRSVGAPVRLPDGTSVGIATDKGWLYVFTGELEPSVEFRFETGDRFLGSLASGKDAFYIGDLAGSFSKILTPELGSIAWTYRLSQAISSPPLLDPVRGKVYVSTEAGELTCIDDRTGTLAWNQIVFGSARVRGPIAVCNGRVICRTFSHTLVAYDGSSGQLLGQTSTLPLADKMVVNSATDRVYLIDRDGRLVCLRPIGKTLPTILTAGLAPVDEAAETRSTEDRPSTEQDQTPADGSDPFPTDPFETDPFGGEPNADPFDAGDPFESNPF
jgi:outer membrane protein assembly factor BamB